MEFPYFPSKKIFGTAYEAIENEFTWFYKITFKKDISDKVKFISALENECEKLTQHI